MCVYISVRVWASVVRGRAARRRCCWARRASVWRAGVRAARVVCAGCAGCAAGVVCGARGARGGAGGGAARRRAARARRRRTARCRRARRTLARRRPENWRCAYKYTYRLIVTLMFS